MDEKFMKEAYKEAIKAYKKREVPVGAVIVKGGEIIGRGHNKREGEKNPLAHAEIEAIREASKTLDSWRLIDCTLYVTLEPCAMCAGAIVNSRIDRVVFGAKDPKRGCCGTVMNLLDEDSFNHKALITSGVLEREASELISSFFRELRENK